MIEKEATRDHTERMLRGFGADLTVEETDEGRKITLTGQPELKPQTIVVPRDPSSAAFPVLRSDYYPRIRRFGAEYWHEPNTRWAVHNLARDGR